MISLDILFYSFPHEMYGEILTIHNQQFTKTSPEYMQKDKRYIKVNTILCFMKKQSITMILMMTKILITFVAHYHELTTCFKSFIALIIYIT